MSSTQVNDLIRSIASLIGVLAWPAVLVLFLLRFRDPIAKFISEVGSLKAKAAGIEISAVRQQVTAAAALGGAAAVRENFSGADHLDVASIADTVQRAFPRGQSERRMGSPTVLWVDDRPENNRYEREALEALEVRVVLARSTEEALIELRSRRFDLVISDMGRPPDPHAGYTLLDTLSPDPPTG